jgi:hypothetical protein
MLNAKEIGMDNLLKIASSKDAVQALEEKNPLNVVSSIADQTVTDPATNLATKVQDYSPQDALSLKRTLYSSANDAKNSRVSRTVYGDVYNQLKPLVYSGVDLAKNPISDEELPALTEKVGGDETLAKALQNEWNNSSTYDQLNAKQSQIIGTSTLADKALNMKTLAAQLPKGEQTAAEKLLGATITGGKQAGIGAGLDIVKGMSPKIAVRTGNILNRISPFTPDAGALSKVPGAVGAASAAVPSYDLSNPQGANPMQNTAAVSPASQPATAASPEALQMMLGLIGLQADPYMASSFTPMIAGAAQPLQKAGAAEGALQSLQGLYGQAGGGQGGGMGLLARLHAMLPGTAGNLYNQQAAQLQQTLQGLGVPGTVTPSLMSGQPASSAGFNTLQQTINALGGNPSAILSTVPAS